MSILALRTSSINIYCIIYFRPILTELKTTEEFEKRRAKSDVFFLFVKDGSQKSEDYKVHT